jgi:type IV secretion system protein TrbF
MFFKRPVQRYGQTSQPETPYQKAAQAWDERIGMARVQARNWRLMALGTLGLAVVLAGGLIWQSGQSRVIPYVVEVDRFGEAQAVTAADAAYQPSDAQIAWYLGRFISNVRSLSIDPIVVRQNWLAAYDYTTDKAAAVLNDFARSNDPFKAVGQRSVSVQITSVVRASETSYQVKWQEQTYEQSALTSTENWTAMLTTVLQPPSTAEVLRKNPLGIYVNGLAWSKEFASPQPIATGGR